MTVQQQTVNASWLAELTLGFEHRQGRTVVASRKHCGPLTIQKPFYPEDEVCHTYILHPPGGVVGGDILNLNINVDKQAHALITTPAAAKFYRSNNKLAQQNNYLSVKQDSILEWLPQETILFAESQVRTLTHVELEEGARFCGWEIFCLGRPASNEKYNIGQCQQVFQLYQNGIPIIIDRARLDGGSNMLDARWGLSGYSVMGIMIVSSANKKMLEQARSAMSEFSGLLSASLIDQVLVCRYLGYHGIEARDRFSQVWFAIRQDWIGKSGCAPRIWST